MGNKLEVKTRKYKKVGISFDLEIPVSISHDDLLEWLQAMLYSDMGQETNPLVNYDLFDLRPTKLKLTKRRFKA